MLTVLGIRLTGIPREAPSLTHVPPFPVASRVGEYSRVVRESFPHRLIKVLGLPVPFRQVLSTFKRLAHESHWTGAQIPCSYHMSNPLLLPHEQSIYKDIMIPT
jgi:hypothetical protein